MEAVRIEAASIADSIGLIDAFRRAGFEACLADEAGTWSVDVAGALDDVATVLLDWMARNERDLAVAHCGGRTYAVARPVAVPAG